MKPKSQPDTPSHLVASSVVCPVCARTYDFAEPITLRATTSHYGLGSWYTADPDPNSSIRFDAGESATARAVLDAFATEVCELVTKFTGHRVTGHYRRR